MARPRGWPCSSLAAWCSFSIIAFIAERRTHKMFYNHEPEEDENDWEDDDDDWEDHDDEDDD